MKHYLAGPMTGYPEFNIPAFRLAKEELEKLGFQIQLPFDIDNEQKDWQWGDYLAEDIRLICNECTGMILMPEWERSRGAKLELAAALMQSLKYSNFEFYEYDSRLTTKYRLKRRTSAIMAGAWFDEWKTYSKEAKVA